MRTRNSSLKLVSCAKLSPRYCGPLEMLEIIGLVAYRLAFPASTRAHNIFHASLLKKYVHDHNHVIGWDTIQMEPKGEFQTEPLHILDRKVIVLRNRAVRQVNVQWNHYGPDEATWELEDAMRLPHPILFNFVKH